MIVIYIYILLITTIDERKKIFEKFEKLFFHDILQQISIYKYKDYVNGMCVFRESFVF